MTPDVVQTPWAAAQDLSFLKTAYDLPIQAWLTLDPATLQSLVERTEVLARWLRGIQKLEALRQSQEDSR